MRREEFEKKVKQALSEIGHCKEIPPIFYFYPCKTINDIQEKEFEIVLFILKTELKYKKRINSDELYRNTFTLKQKIEVYKSALESLEEQTPIDLYVDWGRFVEMLCNEISKVKAEQPKQTSITDVQRVNEIESMFVEFWQAYPRKEAKQAAKKTFMKLRPTAELLAEILSGIEKHKNGEQWQQGKTHIPFPATFINGERWNDEVEEYKPKPNSIRAESVTPDKLPEDDYVLKAMYTVPTLKKRVEK